MPESHADWVREVMVSVAVQGASLAQEETDQGKLERRRRTQLDHAWELAEAIRVRLVQTRPHVARLCAEDAAQRLASATLTPLETSLLRGWRLAARLHVSFLLAHAQAPLPGPLLARMYAQILDTRE